MCGGPSVRKVDLNRLRGRRVIVINSSIHAVPWADVAFFADARWYRVPENRSAVERFSGEVVTLLPTRGPRLISLRRKYPPGLASNRSSITTLKTSLTGAINVAKHKGVSTIVLLGADGRRADDGATHHHAPHKWSVAPGCWDEHATELSTIVSDLNGTVVLNASPNSAWGHLFPVMTLDQALEIVDQKNAVHARFASN